MKRANAITGVVLAIVAILSLVVIIPWQIETGPQGMMSPRLVPQIMMGCVLLLSVLLFVTNLGPDETGAPQPFSQSELRALALIGGIFALSIVLYYLIGPLAFGVTLVAGSLIGLGERRPLVIVAMPLVLLLMLWALFYKVLGTAIL
jgi:putative tricarboxylic transport membrane protein